MHTQFKYKITVRSDGRGAPKVEVDYEGRADTHMKWRDKVVTRQEIASFIELILKGNIGGDIG
jgi:hypothetical protein